MSTRLANIDLSAISGQAIIDTLGVPLSSCGWIEFLNESAYSVELQMGGINIVIPAWYDYPIQIQALSGGIWTPINGAAFPPAITPILLATTTDTLSTMLLTTLYSSGETPASTTPQPLVRQTFVPNTINTFGTQAATLISTNNLASAPIGVISVSVALDPEDTVVFNSDGTASLGDHLYPGSLLIIGAGSNLQVDGTIESDFGAIASNGSGQLTSKILAVTPAAQQTLSNNSTINFTGTAIHVTSSAAVTGIIMQKGTIDGQICIPMNDGAFSITFAASGSNVGSGNNNILNAGRVKFFIWNSTLGMWNSQGGN